MSTKYDGGFSFPRFLALGVILFCPILLVGCANLSARRNVVSNVSIGTPESRSMDADEYAVYNVMIEKSHRKYAAVGSSLIVIKNQTSIFTLNKKGLAETIEVLKSKDLLGDLPRDMVDDFLVKNEQSYQI